MTAHTPMLQQYFRLKEEHPGVIMAIRVGDFYEFYGEDAETAATALEITLTGREDGGQRIPMAGVPYHSVEKYLARLIAQGHRVAICDQLEDPKKAKGLVKRGVTRVLTPGTIVEDSMLQAGQNNFLAAICVLDGNIGLATLDPSTGEFLVTEIGGDERDDRLLAELARIRPAELLVGPQADEFGNLAQNGMGVSVRTTPALNPDRAARKLMEQLQVRKLDGFGCANQPSAVIAASMVLNYAEINGLLLSHVDSLSTYSVDGFMRIDAATRRSLELTQNLHDGSKRFTLVSVLDTCKTPMGTRLLRKWIEQPLLDLASIRARHDAVGRLIENSMVRGELRDEMTKISDIERLVARCATGLASPRDLAALRNSLAVMPRFGTALARVAFGRLADIRDSIVDLAPLRLILEKSIVDDPPHALREGGVIRSDFDSELDALRGLGKSGKNYIAQLEATEREKTGINTLKVGFNSVFGYFLEVGKAHLSKVPDNYIRKQTTANAERYITAELKEHESQVLGAEEKATALESDLFHRIRIQVSEQSRSLVQTAKAIAEIDVLCGFGEISSYRSYTKPTILESSILEITAGRHPVVEATNLTFVPNETEIGGDSKPSLMILTGPNMSGKSTFLRQNALICLMAQIGCYVPAKSAQIGICDRIFARIGAKDELALGQSTFMVEMIESANILNHATEKSLVILDEVGRGTSTYDGMAIAWAMTEYLAEIGCRTMFATHYHQLNALGEQLPNVANFQVAVDEIGSEIIWTHRVIPGGTDQSYGIHVARMAGVPHAVLSRAREILVELEAKGGEPRPTPTQTTKLQMTLFEAEKPEVVGALEDLDVNQLTPIQALGLLDEWKRKWGNS